MEKLSLRPLSIRMQASANTKGPTQASPSSVALAAAFRGAKTIGSAKDGLEGVSKLRRHDAVENEFHRIVDQSQKVE